MNWLRRQIALLLLLASGASAVYFTDPEGLRALENKSAPPAVRAVAPSVEPRVPQAHGVLRLSPVWIGALLHTTGKHVDIEPPADPVARELYRQSQGYLDEIAAARTFIAAYREQAVAAPEWGPEHPYRLALQRRREDRTLIATLNHHRLGDAASLQKLTRKKFAPDSPYANRELALCIEALVKLEALRVLHPPPAAALNQWVSAWNPQSPSSRQTIEDLSRRAGDYRVFAKDYPLAQTWVRIAIDEAKKADDLAKALSQLGRDEKGDALKNLPALRLVLAVLDPDRHPQAFARARRVVVEWCKAETPGDLPLDQVWIGSPRKSAFERRDVKIEWDDGTITTLDELHRGIVYHEVELGRLDKSVRSKITIHTPLGTGSLDDLTASDATKAALDFNESARQLRQRLAEPSSYASIAEAFRAVHKAGSGLEPARRDRLAQLADELDRLP